jgi:hypothetical protein
LARWPLPDSGLGWALTSDMSDADTRGPGPVMSDAGKHDDSIRTATRDLIRIAKAEVAEICADE